MREPALHHPLGRDRRLFWIDGFVRAEQCGRMLEELEFALWRPSGIVHHAGPGRIESRVSPDRVSQSAMESWFSTPLRRMVRALDRRLERMIPRHSRRREEWQATDYSKGGQFDYHFDCGSWADSPGGERELTVLLYLNSPRRGGGTRFCELDVDVRPVAGRLLVWRNLTRDSRRDLEMMHASEPIHAGRKTVLVTWVHQRNLPKRRDT